MHVGHFSGLSGGRGEHGPGSPLRKKLALQLTSDAPSVSLLQCPLCPFTNASSSQLEEHVNRAHLDPLSPSTGSYSEQAVEENNLDCPLCVAKFPSSTELERHVNLAHQDILSPQKVSSVYFLI